jgi:hypothetical protein
MEIANCGSKEWTLKSSSSRKWTAGMSFHGSRLPSELRHLRGHAGARDSLMDDLRNVEAVSAHVEILRMRWMHGRLMPKFKHSSARPDHEHRFWHDDMVRRSCGHAGARDSLVDDLRNFEAVSEHGEILRMRWMHVRLMPKFKHSEARPDHEHGFWHDDMVHGSCGHAGARDSLMDDLRNVEAVSVHGEILRMRWMHGRLTPQQFKHRVARPDYEHGVCHDDMVHGFHERFRSCQASKRRLLVHQASQKVRHQGR